MIKASKASESALYMLADTLGIPLYLMGENYRGIETRDVHLGLWKITTETCVCSDIVESDTVTMLARIHGRVWLYFIATQDGICAYVFDGMVAGLRVKDQSTFGGVSVEDSLSKILPAVKAKFIYNETARAWAKESHDSLLVA
jgi:hypothetical protein